MGLSHSYYILFLSFPSRESGYRCSVFAGTTAWHIRIYGAQLRMTCMKENKQIIKQFYLRVTRQNTSDLRSLKPLQYVTCYVSSRQSLNQQPRDRFSNPTTMIRNPAPGYASGCCRHRAPFLSFIFPIRNYFGTLPLITHITHTTIPKTWKHVSSLQLP